MVWWDVFDQPWTKDVRGVLLVGSVVAAVLLVLGLVIAVLYQRWREGKKAKG